MAKKTNNTFDYLHKLQSSSFTDKEIKENLNIIASQIESFILYSNSIKQMHGGYVQLAWVLYLITEERRLDYPIIKETLEKSKENIIRIILKAISDSSKDPQYFDDIDYPTDLINYLKSLHIVWPEFKAIEESFDSEY